MVESAERRSWFRRLALPVRVTVIAMVMLLVLGGGYWVYRELSRRSAATELALRTCGPDVARVDAQCIGVTDGDVHLTPDLADVLDKIRQENDDVDRSGLPAVSVAYLLALPKPLENEARAIALRHQLEGAYLAQQRANHTEALGAEPPLRLLVANDGDHSQHWQQVAAALADKVGGPERLVAVVATGQTLAGRQEAIGALTDQGIPVIASDLTGDNLTPPASPPPAQGLVRLTPPTSEQAVAAAAYLKREPGVARALIVQSTDPGDAYSRSLGDAFRAAFPDDMHTLLTPMETYNPQLRGVANTMRGMLVNICQQKPDVVFFAGRSPELAALVDALPARPCPDLRINIVAADDAADFATTVARGDNDLHKGINANVSVRYTTLAHPGSWEASAGSFAPGPREFFQSSCKECFRTLFPREFPGQPLDDGSAIIGHDAIVAVIAAIRTREGINDTTNLIIQEFNRMHGPRAVPGASGWISLDERGNPINKAVPILEVKPDGTVAFVQLSSPRSSPCRPDVPELC